MIASQLCQGSTPVVVRFSVHFAIRCLLLVKQWHIQRATPPNRETTVRCNVGGVCYSSIHTKDHKTQCLSAQDSTPQCGTPVSQEDDLPRWTTRWTTRVRSVDAPRDGYRVAARPGLQRLRVAIAAAGEVRSGGSARCGSATRIGHQVRWGTGELSAPEEEMLGMPRKAACDGF